MDDVKNVLRDARRWVEQERVWDAALFASGQTRPSSVRHPPQPLAGDPVGPSVKRAADPAPKSAGNDGVRKAAALQALYERYKDCTRCPLGNARLKFVFGVGNPGADVLFIGEGPGYEEDHRGEPFVGRSGQLLDKMLEAIGLSRKTVYIANIVKCHAMINPQTPDAHGNDRPPTPQEAETCSPILQQQIAVIQPRIIITLGSPATRGILGTTEGITKVRGRFFPMPVAYFKAQSGGQRDLFENNRQESESADKAKNPSQKSERRDVDVLNKEHLIPDFAALTSELSRILVLPTYHPAALLRNPNLKKDAWEDMKLLRDTLQASKSS